MTISSMKTFLRRGKWSNSIGEAVLVTITEVGELHRKDGKANQDFADGMLSQSNIRLSVADGLGSCRYAEIGAQTAVEVIMQLPLEQISLDKEELTARLVDSWRSSLPDAKYAKDYDTTLLFASLEQDKLILGQIGDGLIQWKIGEGPTNELEVAEGAFSNQTVSIAGNSLKDMLQTRTVNIGPNEVPIIVILATDGISGDLDPNLRRALPSILLESLKEKGIEETVRELEIWVSDWKTPCHTDDRTFAFLTVLKKED